MIPASIDRGAVRAALDALGLDVTADHITRVDVAVHSIKVTHHRVVAKAPVLVDESHNHGVDQFDTQRIAEITTEVPIVERAES